jgi:hypothetical protein
LFAHDLANAMWRKSSRSNGDGNVCVEVAFFSSAIAVRDSKNPTGGALVLPTTGWSWFRQATQDSHLYKNIDT